MLGLITTSALSGFGGLKDTKVINNGNNPRVVGGSDRGVELSIDLELNNPSNVILNANADAEFDLLYNNVNCGVVILPNVAVNPGRNRLTARSFARGAEANAACGQMLERFTGGTDISVGVANGRAPDMPSLDGAFGALNLPQQLPANKVPLINSATLIISELNILRLETESRINAANPFDAVVDITRIVADIKDRRSGTTIGKIDQGVSGFRLPSKGSADSPALNTKLILNFAAARALLGALGGSIPITVDSVLTVRLGIMKRQFVMSKTLTQDSPFKLTVISFSQFIQSPSLRISFSPLSLSSLFPTITSLLLFSSPLRVLKLSVIPPTLFCSY
ncbi:hypothetical protein BC829DRAFT_276758 [Chytridium lagenaria]|nr:hypothetical protein BC829DRAFT_276758 [Chytridium lagenaria]